MNRVGLGFVTSMLLAGTASAHIHLTNPLSRTDNVQGDPQKMPHCGDPAYSRAANPQRVTTYPPGAQVMVTWAETINHTSHYRIAFQPNGDTFHQPPPGAGGPTAYPDVDQTGMTDAATGTLVLADMIPDATLQAMVTLPTEECANCTLQFMQVMKDDATYNPNGDLYYNCADIVIQAGAPMPPTGTDAGPGSSDDAGTGSTPGGTGEISGGCSTSGGAASALLGLALVLGLRRRRA